MGEILGVRFVFDEKKITEKQEAVEKFYKQIERQIEQKPYFQLENEILEILDEGLGEDEIENESSKIIEKIENKIQKTPQEIIIENAYYALESELEAKFEREDFKNELEKEVQSAYKKELERLGENENELDIEIKIALKNETEKKILENTKKKLLIDNLHEESKLKKGEIDIKNFKKELESNLDEPGFAADKWLIAKAIESGEKEKKDENSYQCKTQDFFRLYRFVSKNLQKFRDFLKECVWFEEGLEINLLKKGTIAPTAIKNAKSIAFSLREQRLKEYFSDTELPQRLLGVYLEDKSLKFRHSAEAYRSTRGMSFYELAFVMDGLLEKFPWLAQCMKGFVVRDLRG